MSDFAFNIRSCIAHIYNRKHTTQEQVQQKPESSIPLEATEWFETSLK